MGARARKRNSRDLLGRAQRALLRSWALKHAGVILSLILVVSLALTAWQVVRLQEQLLRETAIHSASLYSEALSEFRSVYTSEVVARIAQHDITVTHDYESKKAAIPLPATLSMALGDRIASHHSGAAAKLYSPYPFPWRSNGGLTDEFARDAWNQLTRDPDSPFHRIEEGGVVPRLRYAVADRMRESCVGCHNGHPQSPKLDWEVGDLRGVLEISYPLEGLSAEAQASVTRPFWMLGGVSACALLSLGVVLRRLRRLPDELAERARVAERKRQALESQLHQTQKVETVGTLAGGIAHDFNNLLTPIRGYLDIAIDALPKGKEIRSDLEEAMAATDRARDLVRRILTFSRQSTQQLEPVDLRTAIDEVLVLMRASLPSSIVIRTSFAAECKRVLADPVQLQQVLMNVFTNAGQSMEGGGVIELTLGMTHVDAAQAAERPRLQEGPYVRATIRDSGCGMDRETLARIFDPFFTTKPVGRGTGLGLSVAHGIVTSHDGDLVVESEPGAGTTVDIYLPPTDLAPASANTAPATRTRGHETILFVDDEPAIARLGKRVLERLGYEVVTATRPLEALERFAREPDRFDAVITDQTMPQMTGGQLAVELRRTRPDLPIIGISGFDGDMHPQHASDSIITEWIMKPLIGEDLASAIRRALDSGTTGERVEGPHRHC
jgi:signal transduction histidine kinase/ActR/RegA family two-component response regulator